MASKKKDSVIGFDPLAWMKEASRESGVVSPESKPRESGGSPSTHDSRLSTHDSVVALGDTLTIEQVGAVHAELAGRLGEKQLLLDAGSLTRVDTAGLQLLAAFIHTAESRGACVEWRAPQPALREAARPIGLEGALRLS